jgi:hypothetical protein
LVFCFKYVVASLNIFLVLSCVFGGLLRGESFLLDKYFLYYRVRRLNVLWPIKAAFLSVNKDIKVFKLFTSNNLVM